MVYQIAPSTGLWSTTNAGKAVHDAYTCDLSGLRGNKCVQASCAPILYDRCAVTAPAVSLELPDKSTVRWRPHLLLTHMYECQRCTRFKAAGSKAKVVRVKSHSGCFMMPRNCTGRDKPISHVSTIIDLLPRSPQIGPRRNTGSHHCTYTTREL